MAAGLAAAAAAVVRRARGCRVGLPAARNFSFYTRDAADILLRGTCGGLVTMQLFQPPSAVWGARSHFIIAPRSFCCGKPCGLFPMNACGLARPAEYQLGRPAEVVPFEITEQQARQKFLDWQHGSARLGPGGLLPLGGRWNLRAALLPFWLFEVHARVEYAGSVGSAEK